MQSFCGYRSTYIHSSHELPVIWLGSSLSAVRLFPKAVRVRVGHALDRVQNGLEPPNWKPMPSIGVGVREIRVTSGGQFRVLYTSKHGEAIYVLHAFEKKTRKTSEADLSLARQRLGLVRTSSGGQ